MNLHYVCFFNKLCKIAMCDAFFVIMPDMELKPNDEGSTPINYMWSSVTINYLLKGLFNQKQKTVIYSHSSCSKSL